MPITPKEASSGQVTRLARAQAVTIEQIEIAKDLVTTKFGGMSAQEQREVAAQIVQALATNYLAEVINSKPVPSK